MTKTRKASLAIRNAIIWAVSIMGAATVMIDATDFQKEGLIILLILGWYITSQMLKSGGSHVKEDWADLCGLIRRK